MVAHAGEKAQKTGVFHCAECGEKVSAKEGEKIPKCPNGHTEFDSRTQEPGNN
jgi:DNA-directed RNA polymerase subunit RPC12/RpoP